MGAQKMMYFWSQTLKFAPYLAQNRRFLRSLAGCPSICIKV